MPDNQICVLMPSYGYARFIEDAIKSFIHLELGGSELVIQDGGSTDGTAEIVEAYRQKHNNIRFWSEPDSGQSDALNKAFAKASSRWVGWLNADEFYVPGGLEALLTAGEQNDADVVFGDTLFVGTDGSILRGLPQHPFSHWMLRWYGCFIASVSTIFRRSALGPKPWDEGQMGIMDWDLYLRLARDGAKFLHVPRLVGAFRVHPDRVTANPDVYAADFPEIRRRYGIPSWPGVRSAGRLVHGAVKLGTGAYNRQLSARTLRGRDARWFDGGEGARTMEMLLRKWDRTPRRGTSRRAGV